MIESYRAIYFVDAIGTSQGPREIMFKEHPIFIHVPIVSTMISSPIVDQHPVATPDNELIKDADPVARNVDLVALDVVIHIPLRGLESSQFQMTTLSTYKSMSMMWVMYQIQLLTKKPLLVLNPTSGSLSNER